MRFTLVQTAWTSVFRHGLRAGLTMLGIAIGVAAVVCTAALGEASSARVQAQIDSLGEDFLWVRAGSQTVGGARSGWGTAQTLTDEDAAAIAAEVPGITMCSPVAQGREQIVVPGNNWNTRYQAVLPSFFTIRRRAAASGTLFADADEAASSRVIVMGAATAQRLFDTEDPIGKLVRMNGFPWRIIGVLGPLGADQSSVDRDDVVFVPFSAAYENLNRVEWVTDVMCAVSDPARMDVVEAGVSDLLRARHDLPSEGSDDFTIQKPVQVIEMRAQTSRTMAMLLTSIGAVSLVIAGVGIMNIMLVSVAERSREIGVRMAIGARPSNIRMQFLLEAAVLGLLGGAGGVLLGWVAAHAMSAIFSWPTVVTREAVTIATASACGAGILFGYFPAHIASNLDPIEAIRDER
ncbi:MAG TPA: ABC transporter permease [Vicinamibacterales bacterium]|nr:ABC transporter permease [Vicinamibacterales bacterium]